MDTSIPPDTTPPGAVVLLAATPEAGGFRLTWQKPADDDWGLALVVRYLDGPYGVPAADAVTPSVGSRLGGGVVVFNASGTDFLDARLPPGCAPITYEVWSRDRSKNWSRTPARLVVNPKDAIPVPDAGVTNLTAVRSGMSVNLTWTNPSSDPGFAAVSLVRKSSEAPSSTNDGVLVYTGAATSVSDNLAGADSSLTQFYVGFACNACGGCGRPSISASVAAVLADGGAPGEDGGVLPDGGLPPLVVSNFSVSFSGDNRSIVATWTNPTNSRFAGVRVMRRLGGVPTGPMDSMSTVIFDGLATQASEPSTALLPSSTTTQRTYTYAVYACDVNGCEGLGQTFALTPTVAQLLKGGGYTIFWRHATANVCGDNTGLGTADAGISPNWWKSCDRTCSTATARQLDGVQSSLETTEIHNRFVQKSIPIGRVMSSEFCRCKETAQGLNFGPPTEERPELTYFVYDENNRCNNTYALLNTQPPANANLALISHAGFAGTCNVLANLAWGEAAIFKPQPTGGPLFIVQVPYNGWASLP